MLVNIDEKLHIVIRRQFSIEPRRHFVGQVVYVDGPHVRVKGYMFAFHPGLGQFEKHTELRTCIFNLGDPGLIVSVLPDDVDPNAVGFAMVNNRLCVVCGDRALLDIREFGWS